MRGVVVGWMVAFGMLAQVASAAMPAPHQLSQDELESEIAQNRALAAYVKRNGFPDVAETQNLSDRPPWAAQEVVVYYLDRRSEMRFARASILGRPEVHTIRSERPLTDDEVDKLRARVDRRALGPDERAEASARRAEQAATATERAALAAERAADRTEAVTAQAESAYHRALKK